MIRPRRNRKSPSIRNLVRENLVRCDDMIYPLFLVDGHNKKTELTSLPGHYRWSRDKVLHEIESCLELGIYSYILFPKIDDKNKDDMATYSHDPQNFYLQAAKDIKSRFPEVTLVSDVAMDPYSPAGHDGIVREGQIVNDETLLVLNKMAAAQAEAGFDILGPSDMMDGRVASIRTALDQAGYSDVSIMSYTAKYASAFYGPFRDALSSAPVDDPDIPKDKKTYQMDPANFREAILEAELDEMEGADFLMVKPAIHYLDIIKALRENTTLPIAAYHVSGECAMLIAAAQQGWVDYKEGVSEALLSIKRAGADIIISYFAKDFARWQKS